MKLLSMGKKNYKWHSLILMWVEKVIPQIQKIVVLASNIVYKKRKNYTHELHSKSYLGRDVRSHCYVLSNWFVFYERFREKMGKCQCGFQKH